MRKSLGLAGGLLMASALMTVGMGAASAVTQPVGNPPSPAVLTQHTNVDVIVDDVYPCNGQPTCKTWGMHFVPATVPVGDVTITLHDERQNKTGTLDLIGGTSQFPIHVVGDGGTQETRAQTVQTGIMMSARLVGASPPCCYANASVDVRAPVTLSNDPAHVIVLQVQPGGISAINRQVGMIEPKFESLPIFLPNRPWTGLGITAGRQTHVIVYNSTTARQVCSIVGFAKFKNVGVPKNGRVSKTVPLVWNSSGKYVMSCVAGSQTREFAIWLTS